MAKSRNKVAQDEVLFAVDNGNYEEVMLYRVTMLPGFSYLEWEERAEKAARAWMQDPKHREECNDDLSWDLLCAYLSPSPELEQNGIAAIEWVRNVSRRSTSWRGLRVFSGQETFDDVEESEAT